MTSLEFIEKHIKETQTSIKAFELDYELFHREGDKRDAEKLKQILHHLQQVKSELEAWEVVKNKGVDMLIFMLYYNNLEEYNNYIKSLEGECNYEKCLLTQEEANNIKKALEVEDE